MVNDHPLLKKRKKKPKFNSKSSAQGAKTALEDVWCGDACTRCNQYNKRAQLWKPSTHHLVLLLAHVTKYNEKAAYEVQS